VAKTEERELRDLLETTQSEVRRLKAELAEREKAGPVAQRDEKQEAELQALRTQVQSLEKENAALRSARAEVEKQLATLTADVGEARREAHQARDEVKLLKKQLESTNQALAKSKARVQQLSTRPDSKRSLVDRVRALFGGGKPSEELEAARKEIARLNQQLSLAQFKRRGR
jgi:predicted RNase H-like nuclease (RuvC/YqgF family)